MISLERRHGRALCVGHRGAAALAPENTLESFRAAAAAGVDLIEFDVLELESGELVVAHSNDLGEVSHGRAHGRVRDKSLATLRNAAPDLPTLDDALEFFRVEAPEIGVHVDLKTAKSAEKVLSALRRYALVDRTLVSSFHLRALRRLGALEPGLRTGASFPRDRLHVSSVGGLRPTDPRGSSRHPSSRADGRAHAAHALASVGPRVAPCARDGACGEPGSCSRHSSRRVDRRRHARRGSSRQSRGRRARSEQSSEIRLYTGTVKRGVLVVGAGLLAAFALLGFASGFAIASSSAPEAVVPAQTTAPPPTTEPPPPTEPAPPPPSPPPPAPAPKPQLIAPGVTVGNVSVGWLRSKEATELIQKTFLRPFVLEVDSEHRAQGRPAGVGRTREDREGDPPSA